MLALRHRIVDRFDAGIHINAPPCDRMSDERQLFVRRIEMELCVRRLTVRLCGDVCQHLPHRIRIQKNLQTGLIAILDALDCQYVGNRSRIVNPWARIAFRRIWNHQLQRLAQNSTRRIGLRRNIHEGGLRFLNHKRNFSIRERLQSCAQISERGVHIEHAPNLPCLRDHIRSIEMKAGFHCWLIDLLRELL